MRTFLEEFVYGHKSKMGLFVPKREIYVGMGIITAEWLDFQLNETHLLLGMQRWQKVRKEFVMC